MNRKLWIQKALTMCSLSAVIAVYSMVTLAAPASVVGELTVSGNSTNDSFVTVNGEAVKSDRTISSSSTISTPEGMRATVNFGKLGRLDFAPNTTFTLNAGNDAMSGDLTAGSITVLSAAKGVSVRTLNGDTITLNAGETANATSATASKAAKAGASSGDWWVYALVIGGAIGGIIWAASADNDSKFGSGASTVSPTR